MERVTPIYQHPETRALTLLHQQLKRGMDLRYALPGLSLIHI